MGRSSKPIVREYHVVDNAAPEVEINEEAIVIKEGEALMDLDEVVVKDNYDKVIKIERIDEEVNVNKAGVYKLGYKVTDSSGNVTMIYRDVIVEKDMTMTIILISVASLIALTALGFIGYRFIKRRID